MRAAAGPAEASSANAIIAHWGRRLSRLTGGGRLSADRTSATPSGGATRRRRGARLRLLPALIFVAVLMLGVRVGDIWTAVTDPSAVILSPGSPTQAQSAQDSGRALPPPEQTDQAEAGEGDGTAGAQIAAVPTVAADPALLEELARRREALDSRERALVEQEALLTVAERRVDEKLAEMQALRAELEAMMAGLDEAAEERLQSLVRVYEAMRPGDAATIFDSLELDVLIGVLQRMRENKAAPILANMNPQRAREVTAELAVRRLERPIE